MAAYIALNHHEKWDGSGYPAGKRADETPLTARIVQMADIYDALRAAFPLWATVPLVLGGATLLGYGAAMAGGCTSGHGMCGTAQRSPASLAVTATFMATAIATTFLLRIATGGAL